VIALEALNTLPAADFAAALGAIFEHSPWVAQRAAAARPFDSRLQLLDAMRAAVDAALPEEQWALIRAHPQLGARGRIPAPLTEASAREQRRAGLEACTAEQWVHLDRLNAAYVAKFAMPFILAVRGHDPNSIIEQVERRLGNDPPTERRTALREIGLIAGYRLAATVAAPAGAEIVAMLERLERDGAPTERLEPDAAATPRLEPDAAATQRLERDAAGTQRLLEWMRAAELHVVADGRGGLVGRRYGDRPHAGTVVLGVHYASHAHALRYDGRIGILTGIALVQQLQEKGVRLPFDLCLIAPPAEADAEAGAAGSAVDSDALCGCVTLGEAAAGAADAEAARCQAALSAAGLSRETRVIVRQDRAGIFYRIAATPDPAMRTTAGTDAETPDSAMRTTAAADARASDPATRATAAADATASDPATRATAGADAKAPDRARRATAGADAKAPDPATRATAGADAKAPDRARRTNGGADARAPDLALRATGRARFSPDAALLDSAVRVLEQFLLQNQKHG